MPTHVARSDALAARLLPVPAPPRDQQQQPGAGQQLPQAGQRADPRRQHHFWHQLDVAVLGRRVHAQEDAGLAVAQGFGAHVDLGLCTWWEHLELVTIGERQLGRAQAHAHLQLRVGGVRQAERDRVRTTRQREREGGRPLDAGAVDVELFAQAGNHCRGGLVVDGRGGQGIQHPAPLLDLLRAVGQHAGEGEDLARDLLDQVDSIGQVGTGLIGQRDRDLTRTARAQQGDHVGHQLLRGDQTQPFGGRQQRDQLAHQRGIGHPQIRAGQHHAVA